MRRIALHWQILLALLLSILYGLYFRTSFNLSSEAYRNLEKQGVDSVVIAKCESFKNVNYPNVGSFNTVLKKALTKEEYDKYQKKIKQAAYINEPVSYISWMGDIFIRALKMLIIPLVLSTIISGVANIGGGDNLGRLGLKTLTYYVTTSLLAILTGLFLVNLIKPGIGMDTSMSEHVDGMSTSGASLSQTLIEMIPTNIFSSMNNGDMLPIIFFAVLFGFFINKIGVKPKAILSDFFNAFADVVMKITMFVIKFTPLGVFGIVAKVIADQEDLIGLASSMGLYMLTVLFGIGIHFFISLPLIVKFIGKAHPYRHMKLMSTPLLTAFSTSSSGATLPLTMNAVEKNAGVSNKIASFTLPLGATINMDGTALYECVATLFIAQAYGIELSFMQQSIVVLTALLASIGAAAVPMAGLFMMTVILTAVGLPLEGVGLILSVDRILDMFRTSTNVWSDMCGAVVIAKSEGEQLNV